MTPRTLKGRTALIFAGTLTVFGVLAGVLIVYVINTQVVARAQRQVEHDLKAVRMILDNRVSEIGRGFTLLGCRINRPEIRTAMGLDYLYVVHTDEAGPGTQGAIVAAALKGTGTGGTRLMNRREYRALMGTEAMAPLPVRNTAKAGPVRRTEVPEVMVLEYAHPCLDADGTVREVLVGGIVINHHPDFVDRIMELVYGNRAYADKPVGTVTVFQDDVRISTNVLDHDDNRAIGTRMSAEVYASVVERGVPWQNRAFVVTDWYLTAYEPIRDTDGYTIGALYVGLLERPFVVMRDKSITVFLFILAGMVAAAVLLSFKLAGSILKPVERLRRATARMADGDLTQQVTTRTAFAEMTDLAGTFNRMAAQLDAREKRLDELNKSYLDLIGFVTHELKNILATTILNAYMVRDGYLGIINFKQRRALDAVARNLDYFNATVKNFLNLSRLEKGELTITTAPVRIRADVFDMALEAFGRAAEEKDLHIDNAIPEDLEADGDQTLLQIVANNLVDNAVKYGTPGGIIRLTAAVRGERVEVAVYNDGPLIAPEQAARLFDRFYRIVRKETRRVQGTGLGLHITREIVRQHGGEIRVKPGDNGNTFIFTIQRSMEHGNAA